MLLTLVKKELAYNVLNLRFPLALILGLLLVAFGVFVLEKGYQEEIADYSVRVELHRQFARPKAIRVDRPPNPLMVLFQGVSANAPASFELSLEETPEPLDSAEDEVLTVVFPMLDLTFIIGIVMSLICILFAYDAISGEKQSGTLKLALSGPVPRHTLLLAKWIGGYVSLCPSIILPMLVAFVFLLFSPAVHVTSQLCIAYLIIGGVSLLYTATFFALGLFISVRTKKPATSVIALLLIWLIMVLVIPNVSPYAAKVLVGGPTLQEIERGKRLAKSELYKTLQREHKTASQRKMSKGEAHKTWGNINLRGFRRYKKEVSNLENRLRNSIARETRWAELISSLSPYASFAFAVTDLAGTGVESQRHLLEEIRAFEQLYFQDTGYFKRKFGEGEKIPQMAYTPESIAVRVGHSLPQIAILLLFSMLFFVGAYISFLRYDVR